MCKPLVTVFTPAYNRSSTLRRLWKSLKKQSSFDFEWLIVNDGSTDNTEEIIKELINDTTEFNVRYYSKENGGKHRAINYALPLAQGELFFIVDSDDWLPENSISDITYYYNSIEDKTKFAGVAGCKYLSNGELSGKTFEGEFIDATALQRNELGIIGEKSEVFITSVLRKYPFPDFLNEKFISEAVVWNKIAFDGYKMRWFNKNVYFYEYQEDGLTNNLRKNYRNNPMGYMTYIRQEMEFFKPSFAKKLLWCGKCINTVDLTQINKIDICKMLNISSSFFALSNMFYKLYSKIR